MKYKLWLEFELGNPNQWEIENEFANIQVELENGCKYGINVWTYKYFETSIIQDKENGKNLNGLYQIPPDLLVEKMTRESIERTIDDLLKIDSLEVILNPSIIIEE
jgi:hypothetical protein